jgi:hypothetical protein
MPKIAFEEVGRMVHSAALSGLMRELTVNRHHPP